MTEEVPRELLDFIRAGKKFLVAGHKEPDGDCIGCQIALESVLRRMGKQVVLCSAGPFKRTEIKSYENFFVSSPTETNRAGAGVILVDCSGPERTGDLEPFLEGLPLAVIDHHERGTFTARPGDMAGVFYVDSRAPSAGFLVQKLIEALGVELLKEEAQILLLGLCTDTGFFRHLDSGSAEVFEAASRLVRAGADPKAAFAVINGGKSLESRRRLGHILKRAESHFGGKLILSSENYAESRRFGFESRDSDSLYQLLQAVAGVEAIVIIRQETRKRCTVGVRSRDRVDVGSIAELFGGGGHKNAAGFRHAGTVNELKPKILDAFEKQFTSSFDRDK